MLFRSCIVDGVDDYTYLSMLEQSGVSREEVLKIVKRLTAKLTEYTENDDQLYRVRYALGGMLEKTACNLPG